jgi:hypothetical protein
MGALVLITVWIVPEKQTRKVHGNVYSWEKPGRGKAGKPGRGKGEKQLTFLH